jgi:chlorite dismutase
MTVERDAEPSQRPFVSFGFYKIDPSWRRLAQHERTQQKAEFAEAYNRHAKGDKVTCRSYSTVGVRSDCDLLLWRTSHVLDAIQDMTGEILRTQMGGWLTPTTTLLGMPKTSACDDAGPAPAEHDARLKNVPGHARYVFVYPFVKTREWDLMTHHARQGIMEEQASIGSKYPRVKLSTTYSFGIDDPNFVVILESNYPQDFVDLVAELREAESNRFTVRDTPTFTCIAHPINEALDLLG